MKGSLWSNRDQTHIAGMIAINAETLLFTKVFVNSQKATKPSVEVPKNIDPHGQLAGFLSSQRASSKLAYTDDNLVDYGEFICTTNQT